jgi:hypothetical protein
MVLFTRASVGRLARYLLMLCVLIFFVYLDCLNIITQVHTHFKAWVMLNIKDHAVNMKCWTAITSLIFYFNLCLSVKLDSLSCSFRSRFFLTKCCVHPSIKNLLLLFSTQALEYLETGDLMYTTFSKKESWSKWTWETIQFYT